MGTPRPCSSAGENRGWAQPRQGGHSPCAWRSRPALKKLPKGGRCRDPVGRRAPSPPCRVRGEGGSRPGPVASGVTGQRGTTAERWRGLTPGNWSPSVRREGAGGGATGYLRWWVAGRARAPPQPGLGQRRNRAQRGLRELGTLRVPGAGHTKGSSFSVCFARALEAAGGSAGRGAALGSLMGWGGCLAHSGTKSCWARLCWDPTAARLPVARDRTLELMGTPQFPAWCGWHRGGS